MCTTRIGGVALSTAAKRTAVARLVSGCAKGVCARSCAALSIAGAALLRLRLRSLTSLPNMCNTALFVRDAQVAVRYDSHGPRLDYLELSRFDGQVAARAHGTHDEPVVAAGAILAEQPGDAGAAFELADVDQVQVQAAADRAGPRAVC